MCRSDTLILQSAPSAPRLAREFVTAHVQADLAGTEALSTARLVVSELVTNAVNASEHRLEVDIDLHRRCLVLGVTDDGPGAPRQQDLAPLQPQGRGLLIVDALSRRWGTVPHRRGKRVWAELDVPEEESRVCQLPPTDATGTPQ